MIDSPAKPAVWTLEHLADAPLGRVAVWATPRVREYVRARFDWPLAEMEAGIPPGIETLVVVGGGTLLDYAKVARHDTAPGVRLVAIPSIWGSGAEASPIVVLTHSDRKEIRQGSGFLPDARVVWPELAESVPPDLTRAACGDTWSHAVEGFLCPLANADLRHEIASLASEMLALPLAPDPRWFEVSARACAAQARSGVGLVHGIAHTLEPVLRTEQPGARWGHARLCAAYLWPVLRFVTTTSPKATHLAREYDLPLEQIEATARELFDANDYDAALSTLRANWMRVLRDPCTRMNCVLVRNEHLAFFASFAEGVWR